MNPAALRCGVAWKQQRYRCGSPGCTRCRKRQVRRELGAVMQRLGTPKCWYVPVTIRLGATDDLKRAITKFRADLRNRLNLCRHRSRRWSDAVIWGWFAIREKESGEFEVNAYAIVRIGPLLGRADVHEAIMATWDDPGQVEVGAAVAYDSLRALAKCIIQTAFTQGGYYPSFSDFRGLRFRFGRTRLPSARTEPVFYDAMPVLF